MRALKVLGVSISLALLALGSAHATPIAQQAPEATVSGKKRLNGYQMRQGTSALVGQRGWTSGFRSAPVMHHRGHGTVRAVTPGSNRGKTPVVLVRGYRPVGQSGILVKPISAAEARAKGLRTQTEAAGIANQLARRDAPTSARGQYAGITYKGLSKSGSSYIFGVQSDGNDLIAVPIKRSINRVAVYEQGNWTRHRISSPVQQAAQTIH